MYKAHLFICTNRRDGAEPGETKESCGKKGSADLKDAVKKACKKFPDVRVNAAGCLGHCSKGIAAVLYPEGKWMFNLTSSDEKKLVAEVERACDSK